MGRPFPVSQNKLACSCSAFCGTLNLLHSIFHLTSSQIIYFVVFLSFFMWGHCHYPNHPLPKIHSQNSMFKSELGKLVIRNPNPGFLTSVSTIWNLDNLFWNNCIWILKLRLDLLVQHSLPCYFSFNNQQQAYKTNTFVVKLRNSVHFILFAAFPSNQRKDETGFETLYSSLPVEHLLRFQLFV